jgi:two-component system, OmpR family, sensor kinase
VNTLFFRIFVSFWLAMILILGGAVAVTATVAWYRITTLGNVDAGEMLNDATTALRDAGVPGLKIWLGNIAREHPVLDIYVVDASGNDILERQLPEHIVQWLALDGRPGTAKEGSINARYWPYGYDWAPGGVTASYYPGFNRSHLLANPKIVAPDGTVLTLLVAWFGGTPIDVLGADGITVPLLLIALGISAAICWWLARNISGPVTKLQAAARTFSSGDLDARIDEQLCKRHDELGILARDFNQMATGLKAQIVSKEMLLRDISHELRSPLTRLRVALGLAQRDDGRLDVQLERMERDIERLDTLIGETLQLSRLSGGEPTFARGPVELGHLVDEVVDDAHFEASAVGKYISRSTISGLATLGNFELLRRAVDNVIRNAIRFAPVGSNVEISTRIADGSAIVAVRDHGPGVPENDLHRIFEAFYRVTDSRARESGGIGLGLAITARIMALHGGNAKAQNAADGGLIVELRFPESKMAAPIHAKVDSLVAAVPASRRGYGGLADVPAPR